MTLLFCWGFNYVIYNNMGDMTLFSQTLTLLFYISSVYWSRLLHENINNKKRIHTVFTTKVCKLVHNNKIWKLTLNFPHWIPYLRIY